MSSKSIRPLGYYEQYSSSRHSLGIYKNVTNVTRYLLPASLAEVSGSVSGSTSPLQSVLIRALAAVVNDVPILHVGVVGEDTKKPYYTALAEVDLTKHVDWRTIPDEKAASDDYDVWFLKELADEGVRDWPDVAVQPAWRLLVFPNPQKGWMDVVFSTHHALMDGTSTNVFHQRLVEKLILQDVGSQTETETETETETVLHFSDLPAILPAQESLIRFSTSWRYFLTTVYHVMAPSFLQPPVDPATKPFLGRPPLDRVEVFPIHRGGMQLFDLSPDAVVSLLAACRRHEVTLTALLHAVLLVLWARRVPSATEAPTFNALTPINLRRLVDTATVPDIARGMGNFVAGHAFTVDPKVVKGVRSVQDPNEDDTTLVWNVAAVYGQDLKTRVATVAHNSTAGLLPWVGDWHRYWRGQQGAPRDGTWTLSNLGSIPAAGFADESKNSEWKLLRTFYTQTALGTYPLVSLNLGGIRGGVLSLLVNWTEGVLEDRVGQAFASDLQTCLLGFAKTGKFVVPFPKE